jgi:two-component system, sporulation sensor kinase E
VIGAPRHHCARSKHTVVPIAPGFSAKEAIGQPLHKLHAAELSKADYERFLERVRAGRPTSTTTQRRKKSGETIRVTLKTTPLLDDQGALVGEITIAPDVTELERVATSLRRATVPTGP